jgi:hypothetical protein
MHCVQCLRHLEPVKSDNLTIYLCHNPGCPNYGLYQTGITPADGPAVVDVDEVAERIIREHRDEPPVAATLTKYDGRW